jgi:hypothetical protein
LDGEELLLCPHVEQFSDWTSIAAASSALMEAPVVMA